MSGYDSETHAEAGVFPVVRAVEGSGPGAEAASPAGRVGATLGSADEGADAPAAAGQSAEMHAEGGVFPAVRADGRGGVVAGADLLVIAKEPVAGRVKTRLCPAYTPAEAAALAAAALADTLAVAAAAPAGRRTLALAGAPGAWLPAGFAVVPQRGGGLDERLACAFADAYAGRPIVLIGMDTPQVTPALLARAGAALGEYGAVVGPASDGGFWLLGLRRPDPRLLLGLPMSAAETGAALLARLRSAGLAVGLLPELRDVDTAADAAEVAGLAAARGGRFAAAVRALGERGVPA